MTSSQPWMKLFPGKEFSLWCSSGAFVLLVHLGAAAWLMKDASGSVMSAPTMVMLELAPSPTAPQAAEEFLPPREQYAAQEDVTQEKLKSDEEEELATREDNPQPAKEAALQPDKTVVQDAEVPLPPQKQLKDTRQSKPKKKKQRSAAGAPPKVNAPDAPVAAAPQNSYSSAQMNSANADWKARVNAHVQRRVSAFDTSRSERPQKPSSVRFAIDSNGNVLQIALVSSSGSPEFDEVAVKSINRSSPLPPPPPHLIKSERMVLVMPVRFNAAR